MRNRKKFSNTSSTPRESGVQWDLVRDNDGYAAHEIRIDEGEALSFASFATDFGGVL